MSTPQEGRHAENIERLAELRVEVREIRVDIAEIKADMRPLKEAFQQARGFKAGLMMAGLFLMAVLGAGAREIFGWLIAFFAEKH